VFLNTGVVSMQFMQLSWLWANYKLN